MPIDPTGTSPQALPPEPAPIPEVNMKCRKAGCDSITAVQMPIGQPGSRLYRCVKCNHSWGLNVGGHIDI